jgi:hypothetical protein
MITQKEALNSKNMQGYRILLIGEDRIKLGDEALIGCEKNARWEQIPRDALLDLCKDCVTSSDTFRRKIPSVEEQIEEFMDNLESYIDHKIEEAVNPTEDDGAGGSMCGAYSKFAHMEDLKKQLLNLIK